MLEKTVRCDRCKTHINETKENNVRIGGKLYFMTYDEKGKREEKVIDFDFCDSCAKEFFHWLGHSENMFIPVVGEVL